MNLERYAAMADETPETLRAQIDHQRRLAQLVTDAGVRAEIEKMIEELERRLRELENGEPKQNMRIIPANLGI
jgi:polyhydroxyalkanoate synthesis regulator phasin